MTTDSQIKKRTQFPKTDILLKLPYSPKSHSIPPKLHYWGRPQNPENLQHHNPQKKTDSQIKQEPNFQKTNILLNLPYSTKSDPARSTKITQLGETPKPKTPPTSKPTKSNKSPIPISRSLFLNSGKQKVREGNERKITRHLLMPVEAENGSDESDREGFEEKGE